MFLLLLIVVKLCTFYCFYYFLLLLHYVPFISLIQDFTSVFIRRIAINYYYLEIILYLLLFRKKERKKEKRFFSALDQAIQFENSYKLNLVFSNATCLM